MKKILYAVSRRFVRTIRNVQWNLPHQQIASVQLDAYDELARLKAELAETEYRYGEHLVQESRCWVKSHFKTIAKNHLGSARHKTFAEWSCEAKALTKYFSKNVEKDSQSAIALLMPFESQYKRVRHEQTHGTNRSKSTVGQGGAMHSTQIVH